MALELSNWTDLSCQRIKLVGERHHHRASHCELTFADHLHEFDASNYVLKQTAMSLSRMASQSTYMTTGRRFRSMRPLLRPRSCACCPWLKVLQRELAAEKDRVAEQARENEAAVIHVAKQAAANEAEAKRLSDEAATFQAATDAGAALLQAIAAPAASAQRSAKAAKT
ncbi:hypothetical protein [Janthinobacterium sp. SUN137]|uniref:hypothetical protein n=1 Tax=Janthinobacterium sp. SUN137 TaxID=3014789 RepID=UPI002713EBB7|nr:hypothetical protein [Janthinobacterium sp. SUN137]MDO8039577.1 hypothetical protein [Janthinobacterium sp. SUN137]